MQQGVLHGKRYSAVTASSIYAVTMENARENMRSPAHIADVSGVAESTIKATYKLIDPHVNQNG